jgi:hypothetical protein
MATCFDLKGSSGYYLEKNTEKYDPLGPKHVATTKCTAMQFY